MTIREFIKENRTELERCVKAALETPNTEGKFCPAAEHYSIEELRQWVLNDEGLYRWARAEGVKI